MIKKKIKKIKKTSQRVFHTISKWHLENEQRDSKIYKVHASSKGNGCTKCEQDPLDILGCRVITKAGAKYQWVSAVKKFQSATESYEIGIETP